MERQNLLFLKTFTGRKKHLAENADTVECYGTYIYVKNCALHGYVFTHSMCCLYTLLHAVVGGFLLGDLCFLLFGNSTCKEQVCGALLLYVPICVLLNVLISLAFSWSSWSCHCLWMASANTICLYSLLNFCSTLTMQFSTTQIPERNIMISQFWPFI